MSERQHRAFVPACHIQYCIDMAAIKRWPENHSGKAIGSRAISRLTATLLCLVGLNHHGKVRADQEFIAARLGKSSRALREDLRDLETLGLIQTRQHYDAIKMRVHNTYLIAPVLLLWKKGQALARQAAAAIVATVGNTSSIKRRMDKMHESYRELAKENLRVGTLSTNRKIPAVLSDSSSKKELEANTKGNKQPSASVLELVRLFGVQQAARMARLSHAVVQRMVAGGGLSPPAQAG